MAKNNAYQANANKSLTGGKKTRRKLAKGGGIAVSPLPTRGMPDSINEKNAATMGTLYQQNEYSRLDSGAFIKGGKKVIKSCKRRKKNCKRRRKSCKK